METLTVDTSGLQENLTAAIKQFINDSLDAGIDEPSILAGVYSSFTSVFVSSVMFGTHLDTQAAVELADLMHNVIVKDIYKLSAIKEKIKNANAQCSN